MSTLNLDDMVHIEIEHCYFCGIELNTENKSEWCPFANVNGETVIVNQCKKCDEKNSATGSKMPEQGV